MGRRREGPEETKKNQTPRQAIMVKVGNAILHGLHISFSDVVKGIPNPILIMTIIIKEGDETVIMGL